MLFRSLYWLSRIIYAESGNQILEGKIAVGNVVMNRVNSPKFPDNIYDVLYQKNQFSPASSGSLKRTPNAESVIAAKLVLEGVEIVPGALFFNRAGMACYASRNRAYLTTIGADSSNLSVNSPPPPGQGCIPLLYLSAFYDRASHERSLLRSAQRLQS